MEPEYHDGDLVLVEKYPGCPELQYGEVGAFMVGNSTYIKIYEEEGLVSYNENYDTMTFTEYDNVTLIGRVLGILEPSSITRKMPSDTTPCTRTMRSKANGKTDIPLRCDGQFKDRQCTDGTI